MANLGHSFSRPVFEKGYCIEVRLCNIMWQASLNCLSHKDKYETVIILGVTNVVKKKGIAYQQVGLLSRHRCVGKLGEIIDTVWRWSQRRHCHRRCDYVVVVAESFVGRKA